MYTTKTVGKNIVIYGNGQEKFGLKEGAYLLSPYNPDIVLASDCHGLSFNSTMASMIRTLNFFGEISKEGSES